MQILSPAYGYCAVISEVNKAAVDITDIKKLSYENVGNLVASPAVKRPIWQTIKIVKEIIHIMGDKKPKRIFIEYARGDNLNKGNTSRKKKLRELYENCKQDILDWDNKNWVEEIEAKSDSQLRSNKLFLYYTQMGKSMYTGNPIDLNELLIFSKV